jgi:hypothetical protein
MDEFAEGENPLSMAEFNRNVILFQFNTVKSLMKKLGSDKAVDKFREDNPEFEEKLGGMSIAEDVKKATTRYAAILIDAGDKGENAIISATPTGITKEEEAIWISEQSKLSGLEEDVIKELSDIKRKIEDIRTGVASEKYLFQGMTKGTIFDPKSKEWKEKYSALGEDFFYNLMKNSDQSASNQEAAKEMMAKNIEDASKRAGELKPDLSNIEESLGDLMSGADTLLNKEDINKIQKAYDDYKVDDAKVKEMSDEIISSGAINEEYDESKFINQGSSPKEAKFMSALFRKHFNEKVSGAKNTSELRSIKFGNPSKFTDLNLDQEDSALLNKIIDAIELSDDPSSLVDKYYKEIVADPLYEQIFEDEEVSLDIIEDTISKNLNSLSKLGKILTTLNDATQASIEYDPTDVTHLLESFRLDGSGKLVGDGNLVTKVRELLSQEKNQMIAGESMYSDEGSARQVVLQAEARVAQIDTLYRIVGTDKGFSRQGDANLIANFRARKSGILDRDGKSSLEILGVDASIKGGKFHNLFNRTAVDPLEYSLLKDKDIKLLTPEESAQLAKHEKTLEGMLNARKVLLKVIEDGDRLVEVAQANKNVENIEAIRKRDLAASIKESAGIVKAIIVALDFITDEDFKEFLDWSVNVSPSDISDESLIKGAQMLMKTKEVLNNKMTDQNRLDTIEALRTNKDINNHHIKDFLSNTNVFLNKLSEALNNPDNKVPISEQINAAALVFSNLVTDLDSETVDKVELAKHPEFSDLSNLVIVNGTQGSGKTSVVLGYGVKAAQESQEDTVGKGNAKVLLVSNSEGQVTRLVEEAEEAGLDIKSVDNKKGLSGDVSNDTGYEAKALRDLLKNNDNIDDVTTIVFDEIGLNEYNVTANGVPKNISDAPVMVQILHYIAEINEGRGPNNKLKIVGLGDNMQNVHPGGTLLDTEAVLRSAYLTTNHRSNIASLTTTLEKIGNLGRSVGDISLSTTYGPIQGRTDGLLGGVNYTVNGDPFNDQDVAKNIEEQIELRKKAGGEQFSVALLVDDISKFDSNSVMGKLQAKFPDNIKLATHTEFQGAEADYVIVDINKTKGEESLAYFNRVKTSVGRARYFSLVSDSASDTKLSAKSTEVDTITISNVANASDAMRPLLTAMYADDGQGGTGTKFSPVPTAKTPKPDPKQPNPKSKPKPKTAPPKPNFKTFQEALDALDESLYSDLLHYASEKVKSANYNTVEDKEAAVHRDVKERNPAEYEQLVNSHNAKAILLDVNSNHQAIIAARITLMYPKYNNYKELYDNVVTITNSIDANENVEESGLTGIVKSEYDYFKENDLTKPLLLPKDTSTSLYSKDSTKDADDAMAQLKKNKKARDKKDKADIKLKGKKTPNKDKKDDIKDSLEDLLLKNKKSSNAGDSKARSTKNIKALDDATSTDSKSDAGAAMAAIEDAGFITVYGDKTIDGKPVGLGMDINILQQAGYTSVEVETDPNKYKELKAAALYPNKDNNGKDEFTYEIVGKVDGNKKDLIIVAKNQEGKHIILGGVYAYHSMKKGSIFKTAYENAASKAASDKDNKTGFFKINIKSPRKVLSLLSPGAIKAQKQDETLSDFRSKVDNTGVYYSEEIIISTQSHIEIDGKSVENPYAGEAFLLYSHNKSKIDKKAIASMMKNGLPVSIEEGLKGLKGGIGMIRLDSVASSLNEIYTTVSDVIPSEGSKLIEVVTDTFMQEKLANAFAQLGSIYTGVYNSNQPMSDVEEMLDNNADGNTFDSSSDQVVEEIEAINDINEELGSALYDVMGGMVMDGMLGSIVEGKVVSTKLGERPMVSNEGNNPLTVVKIDEGDFHARFDMSKLFGIVEDVVRNKSNVSESDVLNALDSLLKMSKQFNEGVKVKPIIADRFNSSNVTVSTAVKFPGIEEKLSIRVASVGAPSIRLRATDVTTLLDSYTTVKAKTKAKPKPPKAKTKSAYDILLDEVNAIKSSSDLDSAYNKVRDAEISEDEEDNLNNKLDEIAGSGTLDNDTSGDPAPSSDIAIVEVQDRANDVARRIERTIPFLLDLDDLNGEFTPTLDSLGTDTTTSEAKIEEAKAAIKSNNDARNPDGWFDFLDHKDFPELEGVKWNGSYGTPLKDAFGNDLNFGEGTLQDYIEAKYNAETTTDTTPSISKEMVDIQDSLALFAMGGTDTKSVSDTITDAVEKATRAITANAEDVRKRINDSLGEVYTVSELTDLPKNLLTKYHLYKASKEYKLADIVKKEITKKYFDVGPSSDPSIELANDIKSTPETSMDEVKKNITALNDMRTEGEITDATYNEIFDVIKDRLSGTREAENLKKVISEGKAKDIDVDKVVNKDIGTLIEGSRDENISDTLSDEARSVIKGSWVELENLVSLKEGANNASIPTKEEMDTIISNSEAKFNSYVGFVADPAKVSVLNEEFDAIKENAVTAVLKARNTMSKNTPEPNTEASINNLTPEFYNTDLDFKLSASDKEVINGLDDGLKKITADYLNAKGEAGDIAGVFMELMSLTPKQYNNITEYIQAKHDDSTCR